MSNWFMEYSRYAFAKAKQWSGFVFTIVGFISTFLGFMITFNLIDIETKPRFNIAQCLGMTCVIVLILYILCILFAYIKVGVVSALLRSNPENENCRIQMAEIDEMRFRGLYVDKQIHEIENAKKSVLVSIHSLSDENKKKQYKRFNMALAEAQKRGVEVKVLAPCGIERAKGAYQLVEHYHIAMRFANQLEIEDLRFILVDEEKVVFSQQKAPNKGLSAKFAEVYGKQVGKMLKKYYKEVWSDPYTLNYNKFLIKCTKELFRCDDDIDLNAAAKKLDVPKEALENAFKYGKKN